MQTVMTESVYQQVAQGEWDTLDPRLRTYFGPMAPGTVGSRLRSPFIGEIFRYAGTFTYEHVPRDEGVAE